MLESLRAALLPTALLSSLALAAPLSAQGFVNWESPHVHPLDLTPDGTTLLAVNTPDAQLEVVAVPASLGGRLGSGRAGPPLGWCGPRPHGEAWVVNHISDSVSVIDLATGRVRATLATEDEPADVVFAGTPQRAFVSCSQANSVLVFDPTALSAAPLRVAIFGEDPRALAVSPDGNTVYAAIFESGNGSTVLGGGLAMGGGGFPPNVVNDPAGPYGGTNPPPNAGAAFDPPKTPGNPAPPGVSLIVKKNAAGQWMDDNGGNWTSLVSGAQAAKSGRPVGWNLPDHDVAVIDASTLALTYVDRLMNLVMALDVRPGTGRLAVVGTEATNEIRFEPNLTGTFVRVECALVDPAGPTSTVVDLNGHLTYATGNVSQAQRDLSLGDPRGVAWNDAGTRAWITGMGSNNVVIVDGNGARAGLQPTIEVGEGPTGIVLHEARNRAYVLNKFEATLSVLAVDTQTELGRVPLHDASPPAVKIGRKHLYDTHRNSGLGQVACASCHVDARLDALAWDLGDPAGAMLSVAGSNLAAGVPLLLGPFPDWHPMKGPMTTQTLQDIVGKEPHHWRGDRTGLEAFSGAFVGLQGDDAPPSAGDMQEFEDFLATLTFPPNPYRNFDNSLPTSLPLTGFFTTGDFGPAGLPLGTGNAVQGLALFRPPNLLDGGAVACSTCHAMPSGLGTDTLLNGAFVYQPIAAGPNGERHHALVNIDGTTNVSMKVPQLRNLYEKLGFDMTQQLNTRGAGFVHDGAVDTIQRFISEPVFNLTNNTQVANMVAFMLAFSGSDLPSGSPTGLLEPPGTASRDSHAAVGRQTTLVSAGSPAPGQLTLIGSMHTLANALKVDVIVKGRQGGQSRGYLYLGGGQYQSDRSAETLSSAALQALASPGSELTYSVVPRGTGLRLGIDRDLDTHFDRDELDAGSDPADPLSIPGALVPVHVAALDVDVTSHVVGPQPAGGASGVRAQSAGQKHVATATVRVEDEQGQPVAGALVSAAWSGTTSMRQERLTDAQGEAHFQAPASGLPAHCWTLSLVDLGGDGLLHVPEDDVATSGSAGSDCP